MIVGRRTEASPLQPLIILLDLSVIVRGVEYPIGMPNNMHMLSENSKYIILNVWVCLWGKSNLQEAPVHELEAGKPCRYHFRK